MTHKWGKTMELENICECKKNMRKEIAKTEVLDVSVGKQTVREYQTTYYQCSACQELYYRQKSTLRTDSEQLASSSTGLKPYTGELTARQLIQYSPKHKGTITRIDEMKIRGQ